MTNVRQVTGRTKKEGTQAGERSACDEERQGGGGEGKVWVGERASRAVARSAREGVGELSMVGVTLLYGDDGVGELWGERGCPLVHLKRMYRCLLCYVLSVRQPMVSSW